MSDFNAIECKINVLIIDDDEDDYQVICDLLRDIEDRSFEVTSEHCYDSGLARLGSDKFDVCLVGYCIGGRTGSEFLQAANEAGSTCPIILLSGVMYPGIDAASNEPGVVGFLNKSKLTPNTMQMSIDRAMTMARP